jgi:hypothetical protein
MGLPGQPRPRKIVGEGIDKQRVSMYDKYQNED